MAEKTRLCRSLRIVVVSSSSSSGSSGSESISLLMSRRGRQCKHKAGGQAGGATTTGLALNYRRKKLTP